MCVVSIPRLTNYLHMGSSMEMIYNIYFRCLSEHANNIICLTRNWHIAIHNYIEILEYLS